MIVVRFKVKGQTGKAEELQSALAQVVAPSRKLPGVVSFDIGRDLADPDSFIATEVFENQAALDRQESLPEVARAMAVFPTTLAAPPEVAIYHVSESE